MSPSIASKKAAASFHAIIPRDEFLGMDPDKRFRLWEAHQYLLTDGIMLGMAIFACTIEVTKVAKGDPEVLSPLWFAIAWRIAVGVPHGLGAYFYWGNRREWIRGEWRHVGLGLERAMGPCGFAFMGSPEFRLKGWGALAAGGPAALAVDNPAVKEALVGAILGLVINLFTTSGMKMRIRYHFYQNLAISAMMVAGLPGPSVIFRGEPGSYLPALQQDLAELPWQAWALVAFWNFGVCMLVPYLMDCRNRARYASEMGAGAGGGWARGEKMVRHSWGVEGTLMTELMQMVLRNLNGGKIWDLARELDVYDADGGDGHSQVRTVYLSVDDAWGGGGGGEVPAEEDLAEAVEGALGELPGGRLSLGRRVSFLGESL